MSSQRPASFAQRCAALFAFLLYLWSPICWAITVYTAFRSLWYAVPILTYLLYINGPGLKTVTDFSFPTGLKHAYIWKLMAKYFPVKLHKTADLKRDSKYIFAMHPHGVLSLHAWCSFCTEACGFSKLYPGIDLHVGTLKWNFRCPTVRELMLSLGLVDVSKRTLLKVLQKPGRAVALAVGGAEESLLSCPRTMELVLKKRQGFVRIAVQAGADLVPVLVFGENDVWHARQVKTGILHQIQETIKQLTGFTIPLAHGRGFFFGPVGLLPFQEPINVVVGAPISVEQHTGDMRSEEAVKIVDKYHRLYIQRLMELYNAHKDLYFTNRLSDLKLAE
ncbi:diacylglycerol O-acyltransferase 1 [Trebouxia sp. C0009 RCD-2024]